LSIGKYYFLILLLVPILITTQSAFADNTVDIVIGSGTPGCEETSKGCWRPLIATTDVNGIVRWENKDYDTHTITSGYATWDPDAGVLFDSGLLEPGKFFYVTFPEKGEYPYFCIIHPWMEGKVIVGGVGDRTTTKAADYPFHLPSLGKELSVDVSVNRAEKTSLSNSDVIVLDFSVKNISNKPIDFRYNNFGVFDSKSRFYGLVDSYDLEEAGENLPWGFECTPSWSISADIQPGLTKFYKNICFQIPRDSSVQFALVISEPTNYHDFDECDTRVDFMGEVMCLLITFQPEVASTTMAPSTTPSPTTKQSTTLLDTDRVSKITLSIFYDGRNYGNSLTVEEGEPIQFVGKTTDIYGKPVRAVLDIDGGYTSNFDKKTTSYSDDGNFKYYWGAVHHPNNLKNGVSEYTFIASTKAGSGFIASEIVKLTVIDPKPESILKQEEVIETERETMVSEMQEKSDNGGGCLIATATYGSELAPKVQQLRELRDNTLLQTESGTTFMAGFNQFYYSFSPTIADWERENPVFKETVKLAITPLITSLSLLNYVDMDSEAEVLGYGISLILLNVGMYFVAPGIVIVKLKQKF